MSFSAFTFKSFGQAVRYALTVRYVQAVRFVLAALCLAAGSCLPAEAQRIVQELEANSDMDMMQADSVFMEENGKGSDEKVVPNDIRAWVVDEVYGNMTDTPVDTLHHQYQNSNLPEGINGHYNTLGNLGSPRMSRVYMERPEMMDFMFLTPMDQFFRTVDKCAFYNTKSPFMNIAYNFCGSKETGYDHVRAIYTNNAGKRVNFGGLFDYMYGQGFYDSQSTSFMNASAWASYIGERYDFHAYYQHNFMKMAENGGITDETYITAPEQHRSTQNASNDIPVYLSNTWNRQENDVFFFNHHYNIGFHRDDPADTTGAKKIFVPVTRIFHTLKLGKYMKNYRQYTTPKDYYTNMYFPADTTQDRTKHLSVRNIVGLSLCEGFNRYAAFGINAYIGHEYKRYNMIDSVRTGSGGATYPMQETKYNDLFFGGQIIRTQGSRLHFNVNAQVTFAGERMGDFEINGHTELNFRFLKDTAQVALNAFVKNSTPSFYVRHYHSRYTWYDFNASKEWKMRVEAVLSSRKTKTRLTGAIENVKNYVYFQNTLTPATSSATTFTNAWTPAQYYDMIQVLSLNLRQDFRLGILHFDNDVTLQTSTHQTVLPLPLLSTYHNLYLKFDIAKVLHTEFGADMKYFTLYDAPTYSPTLGMFCNQDPSHVEKIGNFPIISIYANFDLKKCRFYVQYYHANAGTNRYFWAPGYPASPTGVHFGLSWNFYD